MAAVLEKGFSYAGFILIFLSLMCPVFPDEAKGIKGEIKDLKGRIVQLEERLAEYESRDKERVEQNRQLMETANILKGISITGGITSVYQQVHNANGDSSSSKSGNTNSAYSADLEFEKKLFNRARVFLHLETGDGAGADSKLKVFSSVNSDANDSDNNVSVSEAWYEQPLGKLPVVFTLGRLDPTAYIDTNKYANNECSQFLGSAFKNSPVIEFPDNSEGIHIEFSPSSSIDTDFVIIDGSSNGDNFFDDIFLAGQINFKTSFFKKEGNYSLILWMNDCNHTKWDNTKQTKKKGYGAGVSFDQLLTENTGVFLRYGWQNPEVYLNDRDFSLEYAFSIGVEFSGRAWARNEDTFAVGLSGIIPSKEYKRSLGRRGKSEKHMEVYYNFKVNKYFSLSPDLQIIYNSYGGDSVRGDDVIVVSGLRIQAEF